jgi:hypothetical protein
MAGGANSKVKMQNAKVKSRGSIDTSVQTLCAFAPYVALRERYLSLKGCPDFDFCILNFNAVLCGVEA